MSVYVGKKSQRGVTGSKDPVIANVKNVNVTSGSMNKVNGQQIKQLSPMFLGPVSESEFFGNGTETALIFENYWQYSKVFKELGHIEDDGQLTESWYKFRAKGFAKNKGDRHPMGTKSKEIKFVDERGKNHYKYYSANCSVHFGQKLDYIKSRKLIYAPVYAWLVSRTPAFSELEKLVKSGISVQILDNDVLPGSHSVTVDFLKERINDPSVPFGHGYVVAGLLVGIQPEEYC